MKMEDKKYVMENKKYVTVEEVRTDMQHVVNLLKKAEGIIFSLEKDADKESKYPKTIDYAERCMDWARYHICGIIDEFEVMIGEIDEDEEKKQEK